MGQFVRKKMVRTDYILCFLKPVDILNLGFVVKYYLGSLKEIFTKMGLLLKKCDAINFTGCNELLVPCHCCGTWTIIDGY